MPEAVTWRYSQPTKLLGVVGLCVRLADCRLCALRFLEQPADVSAQPACPEADQMLRQTVEWLDGRSAELPPLHVHLDGTPFQLRVWAELQKIKPGQTTTYGAIASTLGSSARAVGGAVGANKVAIYVPCHRVLAAGGGIGGFSVGGRSDRVDIKSALLQLET